MIRYKIRKILNRKHRGFGSGIDPDEVFLDARNLPQFNTQQFEGVLEKPIAKKVFVIIGLIFILIGMLLLWRIGYIQIIDGEMLTTRSENNRLRHAPVFSDRGIIYDRNKVELAWNVSGDKKNTVYSRAYTRKYGFGHLLGYVETPLMDKRGFFFQKEFRGIIGIERVFNSTLSGLNGLKITEIDVAGNLISKSVIERPIDGESVVLSVDSLVQEKLYEFIKTTAENRGFSGGAGIIMDVRKGDILAVTSFPEYDSQILSSGEDRDTIYSYKKDTQNPFFNRAVSGLYVPGSIIKPFIAIGALNENIIKPEESIFSKGYISIPNPYHAGKYSIFTDWYAHGWSNMKEALAVSSNVYFYEIGGGYKNRNGLGIKRVEKYMKKFGFGEKTNLGLSEEPDGLIPSPEWKARVFDGDPWRLGDTYNTVIGQYGFQVTPMQVVRAVSAISNKGSVVEPKLISDKPVKTRQINIPDEYFEIIKSGMRLAVTDGTAKGLNVPFVSVAAKTGTAEVGAEKKLVNSWIIGFFPYEQPRYAFAVVMERGPRDNVIGGVFVMRQLFDWMAKNTPEYFYKIDE